ncbi:MAG: hypothetical protein PHU25_19785 [Deltaproteobacteria bacterium]|nr:hypothetical protein [Deltaproteobacteria bacterium]
MTEHYALGFLGVILTAIGQTLLKIGSTRGKNVSLLRSFLNAFTISAYVLLLVVTLINLRVFAVLPLKAAVVLVPFQFIFVGAFAFFLLKERVTRSQILGSLIVVAGVAIFSM